MYIEIYMIKNIDTHRKRGIKKMGVRYGFKLEREDGKIFYSLEPWKYDERLMVEAYAEQGIVKAEMYVKVPTGFTLDKKTGEVIKVAPKEYSIAHVKAKKLG